MGTVAAKFAGVEQRWKELAREQEIVAVEHAAYYFDAGKVIQAGVEDGIHLDKDQHQRLGIALADALLDPGVR